MRLKIAVNARNLIKSNLEGVGWYAHEILRIMVQNHPNDDFYFFFDRPYHQDFIFGTNVTPIVVPPPARHPILYKIWFNWQLPRHLRAIKPDIFLSLDNFLSMKTNIPQVLVVHDLAILHEPLWIDAQHRKFYQKYLPKFIKKAHRVIAVSEYTKADILNKFGVLDEKVKVVYNGCKNEFHPIDTAEKERIKTEYTDGKPYLLYFGSIHPRKNIVRLVKAFNYFKSKTGKDHKLVLMGRRAWKVKEVVKEIKNSPYKADIVELGYVERDYCEILGAAEMLVYISLFEGFGVPILESMFCQVPIICSNTSSMPEVGGDAALYADPMNVEDIGDKMIRLSADKELQLQLVKNGVKQREKFSWTKSADSVYKCLIDVVGKQRKV